MTHSDKHSGLYGSQATPAEQRDALLSGEIPVAVYGLGKMGLPLAAVYAKTTKNVLGVDVNEDVVATVNAGNCHVKREPGLAEFVEQTVEAGQLRATTDSREAASRCQIHVIIVPTPLDSEKNPDLSMLDVVVQDIATGLAPGDLVIVECTVPPRTCTDRVLPALEGQTGLSTDEFGLAFCPERTSSRQALLDIQGSYPKIVGGVNAESTRVSSLIYTEINSSGVLEAADATTAEAVKLFEGLYRDVNIALANELAQFTDELGIDVNEAIELANTQPYCDIHTPGPGVGGHCIPFYPYFLIRPFETPTPLLETARAVNDGMPRYTVEKTAERLELQGLSLSDAEVLVLGLTYRPDVEEIRATPALPISEQLRESGATVYAVDPVLDSVEAFPVTRLDVDEIYDRPFDAVILVTAHEEFAEIAWDRMTGRRGRLVIIDGRQSLSGMEADHDVYTIGSG